MDERRAQAFLDAAEAGWRWVLDQVGWDADGPWIPESVPGELKPEYRDGMHSGIGALGLALAEVRLCREWTVEEERLAAAIVRRLRDTVATTSDYAYFDGLVSTIGVLTVLGATGVEATGDGTDAAVARLITLAKPDGWPQTFLDKDRFLPDARVNDVVLGTAGVLLGAVWAHRNGATRAGELAGRAADVLIAATEPGPTWPFVPQRFRTDPGPQMPNFSHGLAGIATTLALAGAEFGRPDLTDAARHGAEHLVTLADTTGGGFAVPHRIPGDGSVAYGWCHGPTGTSLLFPALEHAGVNTVAGEPPHGWRRRCLHSVRTSGLPERRYPGFWDNDGRCCGTAGVADVFLDSWQHTGEDADLEFALRLGDTLVDRALRDGPRACWRFVEHTAADPLLPPGVGWMQGTAGIAALLFRAARVVRDGRDAAAVSRMDSWWTRRPPAGQPFASSSSSFL
ncbi:MAG TPA: lanthionine synthetase LanC family protein [Actinophytocola sp.]|nr:lanthionine synthetase LanC family protein [Actinophytocola sp.]